MIRKPKIKRGNYWAIRVGDRYVMEHRLVMEKHIGRLLTKYEAVHHKDHNTLNNDISNLELCATHGEHTKQHHADIFRKNSDEFKGKHFSPATEFKKGDEKLMGNKYRQGLPAWNKGKPWSDDMKKKLSVSHQGKHTANTGSFKKGMVPWNKGLKKS